MPWFVSRLFWWTIALALIAVLGRALWVGYALISAGESLSSIPLSVLTADLDNLQKWAALGAAAGLVIGLLAQTPRLLRLVIRRLRRRADAPASEVRTPDAIIKAERARIADAWLNENDKRELRYVAIDGKHEPTVENRITAREGRFTYRVMAFRTLTEAESRYVVLDALERGLLEEPEPGGTATLLTSIGQQQP